MAEPAHLHPPHLPSELLVAMLLADGRLPTGGYTQSGGLEAAVRAGADDVPAFLAGRLATVARVEAGTAVVARHALLTGTPWSPVEAAWAARTPSEVLRAASRRQGRALLRLAARLWPEMLAWLPADGAVARSVVLGAVGAVAGLSAATTARVVGYDDAQTVVGASLKLLPVDPLDAAAWLAAALPAVDALASSVAPLTAVEDIPDDGAPLLDVLAHQHVTERMRLFHV